MKKLCFSRILNPCSKAATYDFSNKLLEQPNFEKHHIYRSLTVFAQHFDQIQAELYKNSLKLGRRNTGVIYYDCTNFFFEIEEPGADGLRQYWKGKENRPLPIVEMGLFIDRDGTLVIEPPVDYQLDAFEKLEFYPKAIRNLAFLRSRLDFEWVMVTNQDGLGTDSFPEETFWPVHNLVMKTLAGEGICFDKVCIDRSMPEENAPTRKPRTGMLTDYLDNPDYDLANSYVIGDRPTDVELALNLGCKAILLQGDKSLLRCYAAERGSAEAMPWGEEACESFARQLEEVCVLASPDWDKVCEFIFAGERHAEVRRTTRETDIHVSLNLDGTGECQISTGLGFFDHML